MTSMLKGKCLCGSVTFAIKYDFDAFYLCHCEQCQKVTGTAFAANILTQVDNIEWRSGEKLIVNYQDNERDFSKAFCGQCGSGVPHINKSKTQLVIPAGSLTDALQISPSANLFKNESPPWLEHGLSAKSFNGFPN